MPVKQGYKIDGRDQTGADQRHKNKLFKTNHFTKYTAVDILYISTVAAAAAARA